MSEFSDFPYEQALPFSFAVENFHQPGSRHIFFPYFFFQEIPSCENISNFNSAINQVCIFFSECEVFLWERCTF